MGDDSAFGGRINDIPGAALPAFISAGGTAGLSPDAAETPVESPSGSQLFLFLDDQRL